MATRNFKTDAKNYAQGLVYLDFSFNTNGASNPVITGASSTLRGAVSPQDIVSITYAATGKYTILLSDKYRYVVGKSCDLEDVASPDGGYASIGNVTNEGSSTAGISVVVSTFVAAGTLTQFTGRRVSVSLCLKNSTVGT